MARMMKSKGNTRNVLFKDMREIDISILYILSNMRSISIFRQ